MVLKTRETLVELLAATENYSEVINEIRAAIKLRMKEDFDDYSNQADLCFLKCVHDEVPNKALNDRLIIVARITFRSKVGANPNSPFHGSYSVVELQIEARKQLQQMKVIPVAKKRR